MEYPDTSFHTQEVGISSSDDMCLIFYSENFRLLRNLTEGDDIYKWSSVINHLFEIRQDFMEMWDKSGNCS